MDEKKFLNNITNTEIPKKADLENKSNAGQKIYDFLEHTGFLEIRKSDEDFENWLQQLSYGNYKQILTRLNGIIRDINIKSRSIDGQHVRVVFGGEGIDYLPPNSEDKDALFEETFNEIKKLANNEERALFAYYAIQAIHPFIDGNGRTGRLIFELLLPEESEISPERLKQLANHENDATSEARDNFTKEVLEPSKAYYLINRELAREIFGDNFVSEYGSIYYSAQLGIARVSKDLNVSEEEKNLANEILGEGGVRNFPFRGIAVAKLLQENGRLQDVVYQPSRVLAEGEVMTDDIGKKIFAIDAEKFESKMNENDLKKLIEIHREFKQKFIRTLIDIFSNPENHKIKNTKGQILPIKNFF